MKTFSHGDKIKIVGTHGKYWKGRTFRGTVLTVAEIARKLGLDGEAAAEKAKAEGYDAYSTIQEPVFLSSNPEMYRRHEEEFGSARLVEDGEVVEIEGEAVTVRFMGDYQDFIKFV